MAKRAYTYGWAVALRHYRQTRHGYKPLPHHGYCFTWTRPHPEERDQKSKRVYAIYPNKVSARKDKAFRGGDKLVRIKLPLLP